MLRDLQAPIFEANTATDPFCPWMSGQISPSSVSQWDLKTPRRKRRGVLLIVTPYPAMLTQVVTVMFSAQRLFFRKAARRFDRGNLLYPGFPRYIYVDGRTVVCLPV